jgi:hypothetical protein
MLLGEDVQRIQTTHLGQVVVKQHYIQIAMGVCKRKSFLAVGGKQNFGIFAEVSQHLAQAFSHQIMVINDKDFHVRLGQGYGGTDSSNGNSLLSVPACGTRDDHDAKKPAYAGFLKIAVSA